MKRPFLVAFLIIDTLIVVAVVVFVLRGRNATAPIDETPVAEPVEIVAEPSEVIIATRAEPDPAVAEQVVPEMRYLPDNAEIGDRGESGMLKRTTIAKGNRRLSGVRMISDVSENGHFLNPRISPDGLQILVSRPGYAGIWVMSIHGGKPMLVSDENGFRAKWTADGRIEVADEEGNSKVYGTDGMLQESKDASAAAASPVYTENDTIFVADAGGASIPVSGSDDRYFGPVISPDGSQVVYSGLYSGLYVAPTDGSAAPVYIGPGNNPQWAHDGSGIVYDVTQDDGHNMLDGDIYYIDAALTEVSNLTEGDGMIGQLPYIGPDGETVVFEAEGGIYLGTLN